MNEITPFFIIKLQRPEAIHAKPGLKPLQIQLARKHTAQKSCGFNAQDNCGFAASNSNRRLKYLDVIFPVHRRTAYNMHMKPIRINTLAAVIDMPHGKTTQLWQHA